MANIEEIRKWWSVFVGEGNFTEIRLLGRFSYSGYFRSPEAVAQAIEPYTQMDDEQLYFVLNEINDACYGRQQSEKIVKSPKITTSDGDIIRRKWILVDFDPIRASGVNSSNEEYGFAMQKAKDVYYFLLSQGFSDMVICNSGNGVHLQIKVDLPTDDDTKETIKGFLKYLGLQFSDEHVDVDQKNFNEARICKLYSTIAKKGANLPDRPWRKSEILHVPQQIQTTPIERFKALADLVPKEEPKPTPNRSYNSYGGRFDLVSWLGTHGIGYRVKQEGATTKYELEECPWIDKHSDRKKYDSALFQDPDGKVTFNCHHDHCLDKKWHDVRLFYEPNAYTPQQSQFQQYRPQTFSQRNMQPPVEVKSETPELGKKWLDLCEIEDIDLDSIPRIDTGFAEINESFGGGLFFGETTILSGINGSGKSSWLNTLLLNAVQGGNKAALWTGELPAPREKRWILQAAAGEHLMESQRSKGKYYVSKFYKAKIAQWLKGKLRIRNNDYPSNPAQLLADMKELVSEGYTLFVLDNLFAMDLTSSGGSENEQQKALILGVVNFAKKENVHIVLVAHPRKVVTFLRKEDILGSSALQNGVDNIMIIHRVGNDFETRLREYFVPKSARGDTKVSMEAFVHNMMSFSNVIEICKNREFGAIEKIVGINYNMRSKHFYDNRGEYKYGWEEDALQQSINFTPAQVDPNMPFAAQEESDLPF